MPLIKLVCELLLKSIDFLLNCIFIRRYGSWNTLIFPCTDLGTFLKSQLRPFDLKIIYRAIKSVFFHEIDPWGIEIFWPIFRTCTPFFVLVFSCCVKRSIKTIVLFLANHLSFTLRSWDFMDFNFLNLKNSHWAPLFMFQKFWWSFIEHVCAQRGHHFWFGALRLTGFKHLWYLSWWKVSICWFLCQNWDIKCDLWIWLLVAFTYNLEIFVLSYIHSLRSDLYLAPPWCSLSVACNSLPITWHLENLLSQNLKSVILDIGLLDQRLEIDLIARTVFLANGLVTIVWHNVTINIYNFGWVKPRVLHCHNGSCYRKVPINRSHFSICIFLSNNWFVLLLPVNLVAER